MLAAGHRWSALLVVLVAGAIGVSAVDQMKCGLSGHNCPSIIKCDPNDAAGSTATPAAVLTAPSSARTAIRATSTVTTPDHASALECRSRAGAATRARRSIATSRAPALTWTCATRADELRVRLQRHRRVRGCQVQLPGVGRMLLPEVADNLSLRGATHPPDVRCLFLCIAQISLIG
eukprot:CAMPEP_0203815640 /NCGR_PEP_ID=MMETSP0115-20131106/11219_1 /ASSEMBLY_ACC=CAM_ASM_000227 /TAXON_ID=33651 /ORGANISM="Bicosoecid sp, Strain ms1" /LENGTH=176 /DNA_ID=CAMNT_0050724539 /DNA_START=90 /DNA_END=619 /DNA_ORIENTATION=-